MYTTTAMRPKRMREKKIDIPYFNCWEIFLQTAIFLCAKSNAYCPQKRPIFITNMYINYYVLAFEQHEQRSMRVNSWVW
jgi:hypothetical protein